MTRCLVIGANGQDGSYLCEILLDQGHLVWGIGKQATSRYIKNNTNFIYVACDIANTERLGSILDKIQPDEIYHVAAVHGSHGFHYEDNWADALDVNVKSLQSVLEYSRLAENTPSVFYASSAKVFGTPLPTKISIDQPLRTDCLYSITKVAAENLLNYYKNTHGVHGCVAYLFNHESPRRQQQYFIPKIVNILNSALSDNSYRESLYTLDFYCDWGCANEYMHMAIDLLRKPNSSRCIFATGKSILARDFVRWLFEQYNLDYQNHIKTNSTNANLATSIIDIQHTKSILGYTPNRTIYDVSLDMVNRVRSAH